MNLKITSLFTEMAKKRDQNFEETQKYIDTATTVLEVAVFMSIEPPEEGLDKDIFTNYISHAGQILTNAFHQKSVARKSFITPKLNRNIKLVVETI